MPRRRVPPQSRGSNPAERDESSPIAGGLAGGRDRRLAEVAARQFGVVTHRQLLSCGFSASAVHRAAQVGRLHRKHHGVYAVGYPVLGVSGRRLAAVLACGPGAVLSHRSAAALWELRPSGRARIDVTRRFDGIVPTGVDVHRTARLAAGEVTVQDGIPVTTPTRTLADLAAVLRLRDLERALERADRMHVLDARALLRSVRHRRGAPAVRRILAGWEPTRTKSELEVALLRLIRSSPLPAPEVNAQVEGFEADLLWRRERLVAEADSLQFHLTRAAMERDRRRDAVLAAHGYRVLRFTDRQVHRRPGEVIAAIRAALPDRAD